MGTNENSYGHALLQKSVTLSYENSVPRTYTPPKKIGFAPLGMCDGMVDSDVGTGNFLLVMGTLQV